MKAEKSQRPPLVRRPFVLRDEGVRERIINVIRNLPIDTLRPLEVVIQEEQKRRKPDQNALMFAGPLRDIAEQAFLDGRQFSVDTWHEYFKRQLLPEDFDADLCMESYRKWTEDPAGDRVLVGSTKQLTVKGMAQYIEAIHAFGASLGVQFTARGEA